MFADLHHLTTYRGHEVAIFQRGYSRYWAVVKRTAPGRDQANVCEAHPGFHRFPDTAEKCAERWVRRNEGSTP